MCTSCAWAKPAEPHAAEFCENGAKATFWDVTAKRATVDLFAHNRSRLSLSIHGCDHTGGEYGDTDRMFAQPIDSRTFDYVTGRFG